MSDRLKQFILRRVRDLLVAWRNYQLRRAANLVDRTVRDPAQKCPACGVKQLHEMKWSFELRALAHLCGVCGATWAEPPVLDVGVWGGETEVVFPQKVRA